MKGTHVTDDLIGILTAHDFSPSNLSEESFQDYWRGATEYEAGCKIAKDFASLSILQEFLEPSIDWEAAWYNLKVNERYLLVKTNEAYTWALFRTE